MRVLFALLVAFIAVSSLPDVSAQQPPVRLTMEPVSLRTRTGGPIGLRIKLHYNRDQLLEGSLRLKMYDGPRNNGLLRITSSYEGIVLHGSDANFDLLLPPVPDAFDRGFDLEAWFDTKTESIPLSAGSIVRDVPDTFNIMSSDPSHRSTILFSVSGRPDPHRITPLRNDLHDMLSPLKMLPEERHREITWLPANLSGAAMPEDPLELCCCDLILITDGGLNQLDASQLDALTAWTEAGGSLCLVPGDQGLTGRHAEFLRRLLPQDAERMILTDEGRMELASGRATFCASYFGLGRCVLIPYRVSPSTDLTEADRSWIRQFLWKARRCRYPLAGETFADIDREIARLPALRADDNEYDPYRSELQDHLMVQNSQFSQMCRSILMPSDVMMVPTSVIIMLLTAYVLAVGPVDYVVLGLLRIRKYTWIVFPLVTLAFTLTMIAVAHQYLGSSETGKQLTITDVTDDGRPVRSTVIDLEFVGSRRDTTTSHQGRLVTSLEAEHLTLHGRFPHDYEASRRLEQWKPNITRTLTLFPDAIPALGIDWNDTKLITTGRGRQQLRSQLSDNDDVRCLNAMVLHQKSKHQLVSLQDPRLRGLTDAQAQEMAMDGTLHLTHTVSDTVEYGSRAPVQGVYQFFAQVSPGGAAAMEDIPILDQSNPDQWLLLIVLETDDGYHLIRKLYCLPGSNDVPS